LGGGAGARTALRGMIIAGQRLLILIATKPVDFRCGHQALDESTRRACLAQI
jgi:hypothetical protein